MAQSSLAQWVQASIQVVAVGVAIATYFIMIVPQQQLNVAREQLAKAEAGLAKINLDLSDKEPRLAKKSRNCNKFRAT